MPAHQTKFRLLNYKQQRFVNRYLSNGLDEDEAASYAKFTGKNPGSRLLRNTKIIEALTERMASIEAPSMSLEEAKKHITQIARDQSHPKRLDAAKLIVSMHGGFPDQKIVVEHTHTHALAEKLLAELDEAKVVDAVLVEGKQLPETSGS